jgi:release factor glutamine methyltransferase
VRLKQALTSAVDRLESSDVGSPRMNAEVLLMFVLGVNRAYLYAHPERELTAEEESRYDEVLAQRATGMPSQYIIGHQEFWGLDFIVSPAVLIPRPETEHLVETVLELAREVPNPKIVDVGTGSGCIALALAHELKSAEVYAVDVSVEALEIARANAVRLQLDRRVRFLQSNVLEALMNASDLDFVVSNPPYVGFDEADKVQKSVRDFEPRMAVFAGEQGLDVIGPLVQQAHAVLQPRGWLAVEIGYSMRDAVVNLLDPTMWEDVRVVPDLQGIPRVVVARRNSAWLEVTTVKFLLTHCPAINVSYEPMVLPVRVSSARTAAAARASSSSNRITSIGPRKNLSRRSEFSSRRALL